MYRIKNRKEVIKTYRGGIVTPNDLMEYVVTQQMEEEIDDTNALGKLDNSAETGKWI